MKIKIIGKRAEGKTTVGVIIKEALEAQNYNVDFYQEDNQPIIEDRKGNILIEEILNYI